MKLALACVLCTVLGMFLGAFFINAGVQAEAAAVVSCASNPESCGMDADDLDPSERLVPI
jgi:hypothetical protein